MPRASGCDVNKAPLKQASKKKRCYENKPAGFLIEFLSWIAKESRKF